MKPPQISICIPVYNVEPYLRQCLDSVLNQTFTDFEVIIANDASPDNSETIIKEYVKQDQRVKYLKHEKNFGPNTARETALQHARGNYIGFIDSDDWVEPTFLEKLYNTASSNHADVVVCNHYIQSEQGAPNKALAFNIDNSLSIFKWHLNTHGLAPSYCNKLWKRSLFSKPDITFPNIFFGEDMAVTTKLLFYAQTISVVDEPLYYYRIQQKPTISDKLIIKNNALRYVQDEIILHKELFDFFSKRNLKQEITRFMFQRRANLTALVRKAFLTKNKQKQEQVIELLKTYFNDPPYVISPAKIFFEARLGLWIRMVFPLKIVNVIRKFYYRFFLKQ